MSQQNPTIIVGHLDDSELTNAIDKLVNEVANKTTLMAGKFESAIDKMKTAMKDFAITQKVSVDLMKEAWRDMSKSFDAMVSAQSTATGGGKGSGKAFAPNTLGELEQNIAKIKQERRELELNSDELRTRNALLERSKNLYKEQTTSPATRNLNAVMGMQPKSLSDSERQLKLLEFLQRRYAKTTELSVAQQNKLARAIQKTKEQIDKLKPKSLDDVLGMDAKSIDQIAAKMRALKMVQIDPNNTREVNRLGKAYADLKRQQAKMLGQNIQLTHSNNYLAQSFGYIRNRIVYALTLGAITNFVKQLYEIRGQYELLERSLGVLVGSFEKGTQIFNELNEMAIKSPFTLIELGTAAKQLTAYNFAANEVVDTTRRLADISAALGVPMERLTYNLGQIKAQGVLNARDARDFANAGLAIVPMLAKMYTEQKTFGDEMVTTAQVYDMMSKKMVTYGDVLKVLYKVTDEGGKFFDFQAKQADTLRVQMANLTLAYNNMLNEIGAENQGILSGMVGGLKTLLKHWRDIQRILLTLITTFGVYKTVSMLAVGAESIKAWISLAKSIKSAKDAMALFNLTTSANPLGLLASLLAAVIGYFVLFKNEVDEVSREVEMFGESASKTISKVNTLKKVIDGTDETSNTYKKTLSELSNIAKEYGIELDAEKARRDDINKATEQTIQLIKEESAERQRANQLTKAQENYDSQAESARQRLREGLKTAMTGIDFGIFTTKSGNKEIQQNADAIADIIGSIVESNITLIAGKTGDEYEKGLDKMFSLIQDRMRAIGISESTISKQWLSSTLFSNTNLVNEYIDNIVRVKNEQDNYVEKIEKNYNANKKVTQSTMTFTEKVNANARALRNNTEDAISLYNRIYDIVKIAQQNHTINFDLKLTADNPPKWMLDKSLPELQQLAERFTAIAQSGGHAKGYTNETTYQQGLLYASAARQKQEEEERNARNKDHKTKTKQSDEIAKAIKNEISLVKELQGAYDTLTKKGDSHANAIAKVQDLYGKTINLLNKDMDKFGLPRLDLSIIKGNNHNEVLAFFERLRDVLESKGLSNLERMEAVEGVVKEFKLKAETYNLDMITKGLNSELDRLKEEYELAVSLDADPELGSMFADWMGFDMDNLPRTAQEYANRATNALNKALKERDADLELPNLLNITDDDLRELQNRVGTGGITQTYVDEITKAVKEVRDVFKKEKEDTSKEWNALIEKYGGLQAKLLKIYKGTVQQQSSIVKQFGSNEQISQALDLVRKIQISQDPAEIARLQEELAKVLNDVTKNNPVALKAYQATQNEQTSLTSKAYWEDFKDSDLYTMTFEDMSRNSTRAIQLIIDKLNELKFKVKEDPASMKALTKSLEDANKEFESRSSTTTIVNGIKEYISATKEVTAAKKKLNEANQSVAGSEIALKNAQAVGDANAIADATERLERAREKQKEATENAAQAENKLKAAQEKIKAGLNVLSSELQNIEQLLGAVSSLFAAAGDEETAEAINAISKGFSIMTTVIMGVVAALILLEATNPWLLAIAAALSVIVGLVSFLSGNSNKKITEQVEESERAVKRLENAYRELEFAANNAYGTAVSGANQAMKANKELQLVELKRQLALEQSRSSKNKDEDKIIDLTGQIIDLENEISKATSDTLNNLLGISSHGEFFENMISEMISAFKNGEDAMKVFEEKWADMIDNMIMKTIVSQVLQNWVDSLEDGAQKILDKFTEEPSKAVADLTKQMTDIYSQDAGDISEWIYDNDRAAFNEILKSLGVASPNFMRQDRGDWFNAAWDTGLAQKIADAYKGMLGGRMDTLSKNLDKASLDATGDLIDYYSMAGEDFKANYLNVILDKIRENWTFGQDSEKQLSNLQQGISQISETTASALEAYMNSVNQQVYLHSELLTQIRDAIMGTDSDIQLGVQGQMLLQLQNNYIIMQSIQSMMEGWTTPSGQGIRVELIS